MQPINQWSARSWSNIALVGVALLVALQLFSFKHQLSTIQEMEKSPIEYSEMIPEKDHYTAGDLVRFKYQRKTTSEAINKEPLLLLLIDSFQNIDTGEIFSGLVGSRIVRVNDIKDRTASRRLSLDCTTGTYIFEGWAQAQTGRQVRAVAYSSRSFKVTGKDETEKPKLTTQ